MENIESLRRNTELLNTIDWEMTPEEAVRLYLEWGNNWARGNYVIRSKKDETCYFTVSTWKEPPTIYLIRRNSDGAKELAHIKMPERIRKAFMKEHGQLKGVYAVEGIVKTWLQKELGAA